MSVPRPSGRRWRAVIACTAGMALSTVAVSGAGASTGAPGDDPCPDPFPVAELTEGMQTTGLTVEKGTEPDPFTATVVGVVDDGIAPDVDLIVVEADSPAIERAGGVWSGMSGSPVYAPDGRLVGAVAYGFTAAGSPVAGVTPAEHMHALAPSSGPGAAAGAGVDLPDALQERLAASGSVSAEQLHTGLRPLPMPMAVSGLGADRLDVFSDRVGTRLPDVQTFTTGAVSGDAAGSPEDIVPGGNIAAALSYGDVTTAGVGTTTAVCDQAALAFGHPFLWSGATSMSAHSAEAVFVQRDDAFGPFKVANPKGVVGTVEQDRLAGLRARLGEGPDVVPITSAVTSDDREARHGTTHVTVADMLPDIAAFHLLANLDTTLDSVGAGTAEVRWTIDGVRASGEPFELDVSNMYASQWDITFDSAADSFDHLWQIQQNEFEDVTVTGVDYTVDISAHYTTYAVAGVEVRAPDGTWHTPSETDPLSLAAGDDLALRIRLTPYKGRGEDRSVELSLDVPADAVGGSGRVIVAGGRGDESGERPEAGPVSSAADFDELLSSLQSFVPDNALSATLDLAEGEGTEQEGASAREVLDQVVEGSLVFPVEIVAG